MQRFRGEVNCDWQGCRSAVRGKLFRFVHTPDRIQEWQIDGELYIDAILKAKKLGWKVLVAPGSPVYMTLCPTHSEKGE